MEFGKLVNPSLDAMALQPNWYFGVVHDFIEEVHLVLNVCAGVLCHFLDVWDGIQQIYIRFLSGFCYLCQQLAY
jgi:hypothetical protein